MMLEIQVCHRLGSTGWRSPTMSSQGRGSQCMQGDSDGERRPMVLVLSASDRMRPSELP